jgi:hypothetical protein
VSRGEDERRWMEEMRVSHQTCPVASPRMVVLTRAVIGLLTGSPLVLLQPRNNDCRQHIARPTSERLIADGLLQKAVKPFSSSHDIKMRGGSPHPKASSLCRDHRSAASDAGKVSCSKPFVSAPHFLW